ncbi:MAG: hypothetical protein U1C13_11945 [Pseudomonas sp.]|nr:hypothetical protein [Pseudomonas sp.]
MQHPQPGYTLQSENPAAYFFALLLLAVAAFHPIIFVGYTTFDDLNTAVNYGNSSITFTTLEAAKNQGRFTFLWGYPLLQIPHLIDSIYWHAATKIFSVIMLLIALGMVVYQTFRSLWLVVAVTTLFLSLQQNGWDHNAMTAYPFAFNAYASSFLFSLAAFRRSIETASTTTAVLAGLLYFISLGIELFVLFFPLFLLLASSVPTGKFEPRINLRKNRRQIFVQLASVTTYLVCYVLWRRVFPSGYDGNQIHYGSAQSIFNVIWTYSVNAFPLLSLNFVHSEHHQSFFSGSTGLRQLLENLQSSSLLKALCASALIFGLLNSKKLANLRYSSIQIGIAVALISIFLPNLLLGFVEKHQIWVNGNTSSYLYTYYSFIAVCVFLALLLALLSKLLQATKPWLQNLMVVLLTICTLLTTLAVDARNQYIALDQKLAHRKIQLVEQVVATKEFQSMPDNSTLLIGGLLESHHGIAVTTEDFWVSFIKKKNAKSLNFTQDTCPSDSDCYSLVFRQASHQDNQYLIFSKLDDSTQTKSSDLAIFVLPPISGMIITASFESSTKFPTQILINRRPIASLQSNSFTQQIRRSRTSGPIQKIRLNANVGLNPKSVVISTFNFQPEE